MTGVPGLSGPNTLDGRQIALGRSPARTALRMAALVALLGVVFAAGQTSFRHLEAMTVAELVGAVGQHGVLGVHDSQILLSYGSGTGLQVFWVAITPSCSSLGPALALSLISYVMSVGYPLPDRVLAGVAGVASIAVGNTLRIASSVIVGLHSGRASLVLFHDWVGSTFGFGYTVGGFVLVLAILLRRKRRREAA